MERCTPRAEFCQAIQASAERFAEERWGTVVETGRVAADTWMRTHGGAWLRRAPNGWACPRPVRVAGG